MPASDSEPEVSFSEFSLETPVASRSRWVLVWTLVIEAAGMLGSVLIFWLLAQVFDPEAYGLLGGLLAIALTMGPLATFGSTAVMAQGLANGDRPGARIGQGVVMTVIGTVAASVLIAIVQPWIFSGVDRWTVLLLMLAQMTAFWATELAIHATLVIERQRLGALLRVVSSAVRLAGFLIYIGLVEEVTLRGVAWAMLASGSIGAISVHLILGRSVGSMPTLWSPSLGEFRRGLPLGLSLSIEGFLDSTDRPILLRNEFRADAGTYSVAYRVVGLSYIPMMAIIRSFDRAVWRAGSQSVRAGRVEARRIIVRTLPASLLVAVGVYLTAPMVIAVLPAEYSDAIPVLRWLAVLPVIKAVQFPLGNILTVSGLASTRVRATGSAALVNLGLNLALIPHYSWQGAVAATIVAECLLVLIIGAVLIRVGAVSGPKQAVPR